MNIITHAARDLRQRLTPAEKRLWDLVRNRNFLGNKFLRQHPVPVVVDNRKRFFVADYYCHKKKLVLEIDGKIHENQKEHDELRTQIINLLGMTVVRIKNEDTINPAVFAEKIKAFL
jgi:very-short-patch-repair endonuclease